MDNLAVPGTAPVSFRLAPGEALGVSGPSGVGKTRLLRAMADLEPHDGRVCLDGTEQAAVPPAAWRRRVMYLASDSAWWLDRVAEHFAEWPPVGLEALGLDEPLGSRAVEQLSSGERQRLAFLRALERGPEVLLLDEPTANLDPASAERFETQVAERRAADGLMVIWVTHGEGQRGRVAGRSVEVRPA